jgi:hypothetical protein
VSAWKRTEYGWRHAPWWKVAINSLLRFLQPGLRRKLVIYSVCEDGSPPRVVGYGFGRITHR